MKLNTKVHWGGGGGSDRLTLTFHYKCYWQPQNEKRNKMIRKSGLYEDERATLTRGLEGGNK